MDSTRDIVSDLRQPTRAFRAAAPDAWAGFGQLHTAAVAEGTVPTSIKELVALAIGVIQHCDGCVAYHARAAVKAGATREEAAEILAVALLMGGGPSSVWAPRALAAFDECVAEAEAAAT